MGGRKKYQETLIDLFAYKSLEFWQQLPLQLPRVQLLTRTQFIIYIFFYANTREGGEKQHNKEETKIKM